MKPQIKILIAEHDPHDLELILYELTTSGLDYIPMLVQNEKDFTSALNIFIPDLILSDYTFPSFSGPVALEIRKRLAPDTPFIFVSGTIGEEKSIELIRNGLTDYALKDKLFTLNLKVTRALTEADDKKQKEKAEHRLLVSEAKLARAQQLAQMGNWELDNSGEAVLLSAEACRIHGMPQDQDLIPLKTWLSCIHPEDLEIVRQKLQFTSESHSSFSMDYRIVRGNGFISHIHNEGKQAVDAGGKPAGKYGTVQDISAMVLMENKLISERHTRQSEITAAVLTAQEKQRAEIGKELYDDLNQVLGATKMYIELAKKGKADRLMLLGKSTNCLADVIEKISKISRNLSSPGKQVGLFDSIKILMADLIQDHHIDIQFRENNMKEKHLNEKLKLTIFRIVQEQMSNILKHSSASNAVIRLSRRDDEVVLHISDNGSGTDQVNETGGVGIQNIRSMAELYNGTVTIISKPGKGFALKVALSMHFYMDKPEMLTVLPQGNQ